MLVLRSRHERGHANFGWLDTYHSFSFGQYFDPNHMGFRALRVINEDRVAPGSGFATHGHRDMEIVTYILQGALEHKDSLGTGSIIKPGEVQRMSAGTGIRHSEYNPSPTDPVHLLQIWILPDREGLEPSYEQKEIGLADAHGQLKLIASRDGRSGSVTVHQDVSLYAGQLRAGDALTVDLDPHRHAWIQLANGLADLNGQELRAGDGVAVSEEETLHLSTSVGAELLLFDLA